MENTQWRITGYLLLTKSSIEKRIALLPTSFHPADTQRNFNLANLSKLSVRWGGSLLWKMTTYCWGASGDPCRHSICEASTMLEAHEKLSGLMQKLSWSLIYLFTSKKTQPPKQQIKNILQKRNIPEVADVEGGLWKLSEYLQLCKSRTT